MKHYIIKTVDGNRYELHGQSPVQIKYLGLDMISFGTTDDKFKYINKDKIVSMTIWEDKE